MLCERIAALRGGAASGACAPLSAEAGGGKTRLRAVAAHRVGSGVQWLQGASEPVLSAQPVGPLIDMLDLLDLLRYFSRRIDKAGALLVLSCRCDALAGGHPLHGVLCGLPERSFAPTACCDQLQVVFHCGDLRGQASVRVALPSALAGRGRLMDRDRACIAFGLRSGCLV